MSTIRLQLEVEARGDACSSVPVITERDFQAEVVDGHQWTDADQEQIEVITDIVFQAIKGAAETPPPRQKHTWCKADAQAVLLAALKKRMDLPMRTSARKLYKWNSVPDVATVKGMIHYLSNDIGMGPKHLKRVLLPRPHLVSLPVSHMRGVVEYLRDIGASPECIRGLLAKKPALLASSPEWHFLQVEEYLDGLGVRGEDFLTCVREAPSVLLVPVGHKRNINMASMRGVVEELIDFGISSDDLRRVLPQSSRALSDTLPELQRRIRMCREMDVTAADVMLLPKLLTCHVWSLVPRMLLLEGAGFRVTLPTEDNAPFLLSQPPDEAAKQLSLRQVLTMSHRILARLAGHTPEEYGAFRKEWIKGNAFSGAVDSKRKYSKTRLRRLLQEKEDASPVELMDSDEDD